ncbi:phosphatidylinositol-specific phospholipase C/glycerophosphodiester phosphodiesterase family protein [Arenibacter certesii]|uniref:Alkaline phosphatase n=1 Tax=Arenibacter certesii TaxID=228955 RepID=A0A918J313_9FLAO|nr:phosphatidylinositol-specific phospholipase C/glycerophosphodiester phosphodiesterase family protein [Arenibacter certesii]GGW44204.1 hypothetical protein GCM10007383_30750 [Arenibacter certesii]
MNNFRNIIVCFLILGLYTVVGQETKSYKIHSHNDYLQHAPFWDAYDHGLNSIEVDVYLKKGVLYATHSEADIVKEHTIENLYLQPLQKAFSRQLGAQQDIQLLVDIKSEAYSTLIEIITVLQKYPDLIQNPAISIVISGNRPKTEDYTNYPDFIKFDYQNLDSKPNAEAWEKVAMISLNFKKFSHWNGEGRLTVEDLHKVRNTVEKAHSFGKPFRFWGTPDSKTAWKAFIELGVDYINTDKPAMASSFIYSLKD